MGSVAPETVAFIWQRLNQLGISQAEMARRAGIDKSELTRILSGKRNPTLRTLERMARALEVSASDLLSSQPEGAPLRERPEPFNVAGRPEDLRDPRAELRPVYRWGSCGDPLSTDNAPDPDHLEYPPAGRESLVGPRGFAVIVKGDSMTGRAIRDGDVVWVNPDRAVRQNGVVLADVTSETGEQGMVVKVLARDHLSEILMSARAGEDREAVACDYFQVIGPVVLVVSIRPPG